MTFAVDESCSVRLDGRNLLNVPSERVRWLPAPVLERIAKGELVRVNESGVMGLLPCCAPGGRCCRDGNVALDQAWTAKNRGFSCCTQKTVDKEMGREGRVREVRAAWDLLREEQVGLALQGLGVVTGSSGEQPAIPLPSRPMGEQMAPVAPEPSTPVEGGRRAAGGMMASMHSYISKAHMRSPRLLSESVSV